MLAIGLAVVSALGFGSAAIFARIGMERISPMPATLISALASLPSLIALALIFGWDDFRALPAVAYLLFLGHGTLTFIGGRAQNLLSINLIGAARSGPFVGSAALFAALFAIAFLGEELHPLVGLGTVLVVAGLIVSSGDLFRQDWRRDRRSLLGYALALGAAACYGGSNLAAKALSLEYGSPLVVAAMGISFGMMVLLPFSGKGAWAGITSVRAGTLYLALSGWAAGVAVVALYFAFSRSDVVIISPISATNPLFTLLLAHFFLERLEQVTRALFLGALVAVLGVVLVIIGGAL